MDPRQSRRGWDGGDDVNPGSMSPRQTAGPQDRRRSLNIDHSFLSHLAATHSGGFAKTNSNTDAEPSSSLNPTPPPREASAPLHSTNTPAANREGEAGAVSVVPPPALQSASATQAETGSESGTPSLPKQERASKGGSKRSPPRASTKAKEAPRAVPLMPEGSGIPPDHPQSAHFPPFPQDGQSAAPRTSAAGQRSAGGGPRRGSGPKNADAANVATSRRSDRRTADGKGPAPPPPLPTPVMDSPPMLPMQWRPCPGLTLRFKDVHITDAAAPIEDFLRKPVLVRPALVTGATQYRSSNIPPTATDAGHHVSPLSNLDGPGSGAAGSNGACGKDANGAQADRERSVSASRVAPAFPPTGEFSPTSKEEMFETPASSENRTRGSIGYRGGGSDLVSDSMAGSGSRYSPPSRPAGPKSPPPPTASSAGPSSGTFHPASSSVIDTSSAGASLTNNACGGVAEPGIAARLSHAVNSATHAVSVKVRHSLPGAWNSVERKCRGLKPHAVVTGATGTFYAGTVSAIVAVNQEEASALVDVLCGVRVPDIGDVWADRYPVTSSRFSRSVGVVQLDDWAYPELTVADNLEFAASMRTGGRVEHLRERVTAVLKLMALDPDWPVKTLSHSERRRLAVGMELVTDPPAVVVHNPLFGLDRHAAAEFIGLLCHVATFFQKTVVVTLPELPTFVCAALHSCIILGGDGGRSVFAGSVDEVEPFFASLKLRALAHTTHRPATTFAPLPEAPYAGDLGLNPSFAVDARASMYTGAGAAGMSSSTARHFAGPSHATVTPVKRQHAPSQSQSQSASQSAAASRGVSPEAVATRPPRQTSPVPEGHKTPLSDLQRALSEGNEDEYERAFTGAHALDYVFLWAQTSGATKKFAQLFQASEVFSRICQEHNSFLYGPAAASGSGATTSPPPQPGCGDGRAKATGVSGSVTSAAGIRSHRPPPQIEADWETATQATSVPAPVRFWRLFKITLWSRIRQTENYVLWAVFTLSLTLCVWLVKAQKETQLGLFNIRGIVFFLFLMTLQANNMQAPVLLNDTKRFARLKRSGIDVPLSFLAVLITFMIATRVIFLVPLGAAVALLISGSDMTSLFGLAGCLSATHGVLVLLLILYAKRIDGWVQWVLVGFVAYSTLFSGFLLNIRTSPASDLSKLSLVRYGYGAALVDYLQTQLFACELVRGSHGEPVNCYTGKAYLEGQGFENDTVRGTLAGYGIVAGVGLVLAGIVLSKGF